LRAKENMNVATTANALYSVQNETKKTLRLLPHIRVGGKSRRLLGKEAFRITFSALIIIGTLVGIVFYFQNLNTVTLSPTTTPNPSSSSPPTPIPTSLPNVKVPTSPTLVIRDLNDSVKYRTFNVSTGWNSWVQLFGQNTNDTPAAVLVGGELHIVIRSVNDSLSYGYVNGNGVFSNWTQISGSTPSAPTLTSDGTALCLVVRNEDNSTKYCFYDLEFRRWNSWVIIPNGTTCDSPAAIIYAGKLHLVVRNIDSDIDITYGYIWHSYVDLSTGNFSGWHQIGDIGKTQSAPTLAASELFNEVFLLVRGADGRICINTMNSSNWEGWVVIPNWSTVVGPGACVIGDELRAIMPNSGGGFWQVRVFLDTNAFSVRQIDADLEKTSSKPTLTG
jgi:hypothetical protein